MTDPLKKPNADDVSEGLEGGSGRYIVINDRDTYRAVKDGDLREPMNLGDFLMALGIVLRLPGKERASTAGEIIEAIPAQKRHGSRLASIVLAAIVLILVAVALPSLFPDRSDRIPPRLIGSWQTLTPRFAQRGFEVRDNDLRVRRGPNETDVAVLAIRRVRVTQRGADTDVQIEYMEDGAPQSFDLTMHDTPGGPMLELKNQPDVVWRRARPLGRAPNLPPGLELAPGATPNAARKR